MILDDIVAYKRAELAGQIARAPLAEVRARAESAEPVRDFGRVLRGQDVRLIAEIKKASPVKGVLFPDLDPVALARKYAAAGAAAISVLTDERFFQGHLSFLSQIRSGLAAVGATTPLLRKDFLFDPYQVYEARAAGADAILLIVAILDQVQLTEYRQLAEELGLAALVETHDEGEVERALTAGARIIGINNRDLRTFTVDLGTTEKLRRLIPTDRIVVSESGIAGPAHVRRLAEWRVDAMLVGESLVTSGDVAAKVAELLA
ncbi:MAG TPA: indole-3-glycerol phosphate synthase TrpC [Dehalococcoidia bacterium]|nr:indole-3-glycerol phosphate synthase TrpC [Dehalococcoidia bacterium]